MVPEAQVTFYDTKTLSGAEGWHVEAAARAARAGWKMEQVLALLERVTAATDTVYTLATLKYLIHGGRISHLKGLLASVLNIKPELKRLLYFAWLGDAGRTKAVELARFFRRGGVASLVEFNQKNLRNQFARANKLAASWVCVVGEDEVARGRFQLKDMAAGTQTEGTPGELLDLVRRAPSDPA